MNALTPALGTFILVDDDHEDAYLIQRALDHGRISAELLHLPNGPAFFEFVKNHGLPHKTLVLLDINMPQFNGFEVLHYLNRIQLLRNLPIIILTTTSDQSQVDKAYQMGAKAFITKPRSLNETTELMKGLTQTWFNNGRSPRIDPIDGLGDDL